MRSGADCGTKGLPAQWAGGNRSPAGSAKPVSSIASRYPRKRLKSRWLEDSGDVREIQELAPDSRRHPGKSLGLGREFAAAVLLARSTRTESPVLETETVKGGMNRAATSAAIGRKRRDREERSRRVCQTECKFTIVLLNLRVTNADNGPRTPRQ